MVKENPPRKTPKKRGRPQKHPLPIESSHSETPITCSVRRAAKLLGLGTTKMYELIMKDELASFCVGSRRLIPYSELLRFSQTRSGQ